MKTYTEKELVDFGNYLLSPQRNERVSDQTRDSVGHWDICNWEKEPNRGSFLEISGYNDGRGKCTAVRLNHRILQFIPEIFRKHFDTKFLFETRKEAEEFVRRNEVPIKLDEKEPEVIRVDAVEFARDLKRIALDRTVSMDVTYDSDRCYFTVTYR